MLRTVEIQKFEEFGRRFVFAVQEQAVHPINRLEEEIIDCCRIPSRAEDVIGKIGKRYPKDDVASAVGLLQKNRIITSESDQTESVLPPYVTSSNKFHLTLNLTQACNLRCKYCYVAKAPADAESSFMTIETARGAVDFMLNEFADLKSLGISFYGGEPLMNFSVMKEVMQYATDAAKSKGLPEVDFHFNTNGTLLVDTVIDSIRDFNVDVQVSIDGDSAVHDAMRVFPEGSGSHSIIMANLNRLLSAKGRHHVSVSGVITHNSRLKEVYDYLSTFGFKDIKLSYVRYLEDCEYALTNSDKETYISDMKEIANDCLRMIMQGNRPPAYNFESKILQLWSHTRRRFFCPAAMTRFGISPRGDIHPCGPAAAMGIMKIGSLDKGLNHEERERLLQSFSLENRQGCNSCWARYLCAGGCPLPLVRTYDEDCRMALEATKLAVAMFAMVREKNELLLSSLIDAGFLPSLISKLDGNEGGQRNVSD